VRSSSLLFAAALVGLLLPLPLGLHPAHADGGSNRPDIMPVSDIHPGMKGYGLTVFQGTKPERFDVEVIDVLRNFRPKQDLILVKTKHPRLEITKVVAGMSGSPIYLNDKMIGAYAYGWSFGSEPVAGVTPIRNMLDDLARPLPDHIDGWPLKLMPVAGKPAKGPERRASNDGGRRYQGELGRYDVREHAAQLARAVGIDNSRVVSALTPVSTPILIGGMSSRSIAFAQQLMAPLGLEPLQAGGGASPEASAAVVRLHELTSYLASCGVATFLTVAQQGMLGQNMASPIDVSYIADTMFMMRFFEAGGHVHKAVSILKKRTGLHETAIREIGIKDNKLTVGEPLVAFRGVLTGVPEYRGSSLDEKLRVGKRA